MQFKNNVNFNLKQLKNAIIEKLATEPTTDLVAGRVYYNTTNNKFFIYNGTAWSQLSDQSMTDQQILDAIKRVDGSNSGLDADLLDGNNGAYYMPASTTLNSIPAPTGDVSMNGHKITGLGAPTANTNDAATTSYVDSKVQAIVNGLDPKESVKAASNSTSYSLSNISYPVSVDGQSITDGQRILLKNQSSAIENGIYVVQQAGASANLVRANDATVGTGATLGNGAYVFVESGLQSGTGWLYNSTSYEWTKFTEQTIIAEGTGIDTSTSGGTTTVSIDTTVVARKVVATLGSASANSPITVTHGLGSTSVAVSVIEASSGEIVLADVAIVDTTNITVTFADAVTANQYRVIVVG